jgi:hypothetical protein
MRLVGPMEEVPVSGEVNRISMAKGRSEVLRRLVSAGLVLGTLACVSEQTTTEPSSSPSLAQAVATSVAAVPAIAVHPSKNLDPKGRTVTVTGKGFPPNVSLQLAECTSFPLTCQALMDVTTSRRGTFVSRVLVAFDFTVLNLFPPVPTCSEPTFTGDRCLLFATATVGFASAFRPITFSQ